MGGTDAFPDIEATATDVVEATLRVAGLDAQSLGATLGYVVAAVEKKTGITTDLTMLDSMRQEYLVNGTLDHIQPHEPEE